ncbi:MAG: vitamin K epoxide reductase family protein [Pirellula sp.]
MSLIDLRFQNLIRPTSVQPRQRFSHAISSDKARIIPALAWWTMFASSASAFLASGYLAWASLTSSAVAGCGGGSVFDCDHVLHSRWSNVMSIPVSIPAIALHTVILSMLLLNPVSQRLQTARWWLVGIASLSAGAAAVWFIGLQVFWIGHLCQYCLVAHAGGLILGGVSIWNLPIPIHSYRWIGGGAATGVLGLIALQTLSAAPVTHKLIDYPENGGGFESTETEESSLFEAPKGLIATHASLVHDRFQNSVVQASSLFWAYMNPLSIANCQVAVGIDEGQARSTRILNNVKLETNAWPLLGKSDAELVFVELFDYTCEHCQRTHKAIEGARQKFGDRLAIIALPVPMDGKCNPTVKSTDASHLEACDIAKLAVAVWAVDKGKFAEFHHYLFTAKPNYATALAKAKELVDTEKLKAMQSSPLPNEYVAKHVALYQRAGAGTIPKLMFPKTSSVGAIESAEVIVHLVEQHLR